jgi:hypothetical protein
VTPTHHAHIRPADYQENGRPIPAWDVVCRHCRTCRGPYLDRTEAQAWVDGHNLAVQHIERGAA